MANTDTTRAVAADEVPARSTTIYPQPFAARMVGREKRALGDFFGLKNFGINQTRLAPKAISALRHSHARQDEFIYILQGHPTLHTDTGSIRLSPGMCAGVPAGSGIACNLENETTEDVVYLEIGDRTPGDQATYPDDDLVAVHAHGQWQFQHKDGSPY